MQDAFGGQPFVQLLQSEGLSEQLQDVVLYSIAMCDSNQAAAARDAAAGLPQTRSPAAAEAGGSTEQQAEAGAQLPQEQARGSDAEGAGGGQRAVLMTAEDGWRALQLYMASAGKYAAGGSAFMALLYGVGELPQVRSGLEVMRQHCMVSCGLR